MPQYSTHPIDWKEPVAEALAALRVAYPDHDVLLNTDLDRVARHYATLSLEEGAAALGQELSRFGAALYRLDTGSDDAAFLLMTEVQNTPAVTRHDLTWRIPHDVTNSVEQGSARLQVQPGRAWGAPAKRLRAPSLNLRHAAGPLAEWNLGVETGFQWLDDRLGVLARNGATGECTDEVRTQSHLVDVTRWLEQDDGIAHMFVATFDVPGLSAIPADGPDGVRAALRRPDGTVLVLSASTPHVVQATLSLPTQFPPGLPQYLPASATDATLVPPEAITARYSADHLLHTTDGRLWLACSVDIDERRLRPFLRSTDSAKAAATTLQSRATVFIAYDANGEPLGWQLVSPGRECWSRRAAWITAPAAHAGASTRWFLLRDIVDDAGEQRCSASLLQLSSTPTGLEIQPIATPHCTLNGNAVWMAQVPGLPDCLDGYVLSAAESPRVGGIGGEFACVAVRLDDGRSWSRSLRGMQPRFGEYRYDQSIHLSPLPDRWMLLDLVGDNFGLQDTAWLWNLETDEYWAIPLAAISPARENGALHYHPVTRSLVAHFTSIDHDATLQMLQPLEEIIAAVTGVATCRHRAAPWEVATMTMPR